MANIDKVQAAILEFEAISGPVTFSAEDRGDGLILLCATYEESDDMPDDAPWSIYGGYKIIDRTGLRGGNAGMDNFIDKYGDNLLSQWLQLWPID
jgi:hypothetical protein